MTKKKDDDLTWFKRLMIEKSSYVVAIALISVVGWIANYFVSLGVRVGRVEAATIACDNRTEILISKVNSVVIGIQSIRCVLGEKTACIDDKK